MGVITNFPDGLSSFGIPLFGGGVFSPFGNVWFVDTVNGSDASESDGKSPESPFATMEHTFEFIGDNDVIYFIGKVREQLVAPLGVTGVRIVGVPGGNVRDDDGAKWYAPASPVAGQALIEIREQGWVFENFLMSPDTTSGACIKAHRNEDATYPDSSHFICRNMRFVGTGGTTYGIQDVGGNHNYIIDGCRFQSLAKGIYCSSTSIATPLRNQIINCDFYACTSDIESTQSYGLLQGNKHFYASATTKINIAGAGGGGNNIVTGCVFPNVAADIDPGNGYDGNATDTWTANNAADAVVFGDPA